MEAGGHRQVYQWLLVIYIEDEVNEQFWMKTLRGDGGCSVERGLTSIVYNLNWR